jgi:hypothetical protein
VVRVPRALTKPGFAGLVEKQDNVGSRAQLAELGIDRHLISRRDESGIWQTIGPHVVVLHGGNLSERQQQWAGVLHAGPGAALFGLTALQADGLRGLVSEVVQTVVPHGRGRRDLATEQVTITVHESQQTSDADIRRGTRPPRQRADRAAVDAAAWAPTDATARTIVAAAVQQRLVAARHLLPDVARRPTLPRRALLLETLADVEGGRSRCPSWSGPTASAASGCPPRAGSGW